MIPTSIGTVSEEYGWARQPYHALAFLEPSIAGVSAQSFVHCFTLASAAFNLQVATPGVSSHHSQGTLSCSPLLG